MILVFNALGENFSRLNNITENKRSIVGEMGECTGGWYVALEVQFNCLVVLDNS